MNEYRIAQISENEFIAQVRLQNKDRVFEWSGITIEEFLVVNNYELQLRWCVVSTLERAKSIIKSHQKKWKTYPIYHKP